MFGAEGSLEEELAALRARGAQVALDDAGAGYAGLQQIIRIAPDILKLDRALIHGAHADPSRQALLEALIGFASSTGAAICAEGVEDLEDLRTLVSLDVTYAQGYGLARPGAGLAVAGARGDPRRRGADQGRPAHGERPARRRRGLRERARGPRRPSRGGDQHSRSRRRAPSRAAELLGADDVSLMRVDRATDELVLLSHNDANDVGTRWSLDDFPATRYVLDHRVPGQVVAGDEAGDAAELAELAELGFGAVVIVPVVFGGRELAVLEVYRVRAQAFTAREVDRARVLAQQFAAALDRLS